MSSSQAIRKRSIVLNGHKTSVSLENEFWESLRDIAADRGERLTELIELIEFQRVKGHNLSSAIRLFVLAHYQAHSLKRFAA